MCRRKGGFTLIETIIAMAILGSVLAIVLSFMAKSLHGFIKSKDVTIATHLARKQIEFVKNIKFPPTQYNRTIEDIARTPSTDNSDFEIEQVVVNTPVAGNALLKEVTVNVYKAKTGALVVTLITYIARNGI